MGNKKLHRRPSRGDAASFYPILIRLVGAERIGYNGLDVHLPLLIDTMRVRMMGSGRVIRCPRDMLT